MAECSTSYRWIGNMSLWMLLCPVLFVMGVTSIVLFIFLFLLTIGVNTYNSYKFSLEKGVIVGILAFMLAMVLDVGFVIMVHRVLSSFALNG